MGFKGTQAAKESSDMILLNDRFETIALAIRIGRVLTNNIVLSTEYLLSCTLSIVLLMAISSLVGSHLPLNAVQILWLNIITVTCPALSLAFEPGSSKLMNEPTRKYHQGLVSKSHILLLLSWSLLLAAGALVTYFVTLEIFKLPMPLVSSLTFTTLALSQTLHLLNIQAFHEGGSKVAFLLEIIKVPLTWMILGFAALFQVAAIYIPLLQVTLGTAPIPYHYWAIPILVSLTLIGTAMGQIHSRPEATDH